MMYWWDGPSGVGAWIGVGLMALFWVAVIVGVVYLVRYLSRERDAGGSRAGSSGEHDGESSSGRGAKSEAMRILEERYARGDIDREEFLKLKADLSG